MNKVCVTATLPEINKIRTLCEQNQIEWFKIYDCPYDMWVTNPLNINNAEWLHNILMDNAMANPGYSTIN